MTRGRYALLAAILSLLPMLLPLSVDGSLPLVPAIAAEFGGGAAAAQYGLSSVVAGIAAGQLVHGPLSDRLGRKPVILGGLLLFALSAAAGAAATGVEMLVAVRFLQGFFACSGVIVARAVIRDLFDREDGARMFALMMGLHGIMPAVAPGASGWLLQEWGWRAVMAAMAAFGLLAFLAVLAGLAESARPRDRGAAAPPALARTFLRVLAHPGFRTNAACGSFAYAGLFAYFAGAPSGLIGYLGLGPAEYGVAMAVPMIAYVVTQIAIARAVRRLGADRMILAGIVLGLLAGAGLALVVAAGEPSLHSLIAPIVLLLMSLAFILPATTAGAVSPFPEAAGAASSLLGFVQFMAAAAATAAVGALADGTPGPMAAAILACALCCAAAGLALRRARDAAR